MFEGLSVMLGSIGHEIGACVDSALGMGDRGTYSSDDYRYPEGDSSLDEFDRIFDLITKIEYFLLGDPEHISGSCARVIDRCKQNSIPLDANNAEYISSIVKEPANIVREAAPINRLLIFLEENGESTHPNDLWRIAEVAKAIGDFMSSHEKGHPINYEEIAENCNKDIQLVLRIKDLLEKYSAQYMRDLPNEYADKCNQEKNAEADISEKKEQHYLDMIKAISEHEDFGKRNPVDIGIDLGFEEKDVMEMIEMAKKVNEK